MDYAFAPGDTLYDKSFKMYFSRQGMTTKVVSTIMGTLKEFIDKLKTDQNIIKPIGNLHLVSHATESGWMAMALDFIPSIKITFSYLKDVAHPLDGSRSKIEIPSVILPKNQNGDPKPIKVRIYGCNIGKSQPFLNLFKEALGNIVTVTAPKHMDVIADENIWPITGSLEYLNYSFEVSFPKQLVSENIIKAFVDDEKLKYYDGLRIEKKDWEKWLKGIRGNVLKKQPFWYQVNLNPKVDNLPKSPGWLGCFQYFPEEDGPHQPGGKNPSPDTEENRRKFMEDYFKTFDDFDPGKTRFTYYQQWGYETFQDFMKGFDWKPDKKDPSKWLGTRHTYQCAIPVTNRETRNNELLFNYVPKIGIGTHFGLARLEGNTSLFGSSQEAD